MTTQELANKADLYQIDPNTITENESGIHLFTNKFPLSSLSNLSLEEYANGGNENSFCYWLEFKKIGFGIGGGNSSKFGIYRTNVNGGWKYATGFGSKKTILNEENANIFFNKLRENIIQVIHWAKENEIEKISTLGLPMYNMVLLKILSIYLPEKFLAIGSPKVLIKCAQSLGLKNIELTASNAIAINFHCKQTLHSLPSFSNWESEKLNRFIWENFNEPNQNQNSSKVNYWLYAPGERAKYWNEFYEKGIMALGWDELGDLRQYQSNDEVNNRFKEIEADDKSRMNFAKANFEFLAKAKIGDYVLVKSGRQELVGYGVISSDYYFDESRETYKSCRKVDWKEKGNWNVDHDMVVKTFTEVGKYKTEDLNYATYGERLLAIMKDNILEKSTQLPTITHPLNTIFYGPPGTGKTYHTILRAAEIIANKTIQNYDEAKRIFQEHLGNRIEFITFHQNYSYEDFIQGLRPIQNSNGPLAFEMKDGIFKKIAHRAEEDYLSSQWKEINKRPFEDTFQDFFDELLNGEVEEIEIPMKKASYFITNIGSKSLEFRKASGGTAHTLSINTLRQMYISESTLKSHGLSVYYAPLLDQLLKKGKSKGNSTTGKELQSYVIVIDEINRANISRVFGELITLIEPDKRLGASNELTIKLPNDEVFCIPKNLYLIGTMNTADKSIALLDIALRRRFDFEPMYPIYETHGAPIPFASYLEKMNQEIIRSKGHDFQIGHAYFMGENENLVSIINQKVIPLLMEYFMNDGDEVKRILQKSGFVVEEKSWPLKISGTI